MFKALLLITVGLYLCHVASASASNLDKTNLRELNNAIQDVLTPLIGARPPLVRCEHCLIKEDTFSVERPVTGSAQFINFITLIKRFPSEVEEAMRQMFDVAPLDTYMVKTIVVNDNLELGLIRVHVIAMKKISKTEVIYGVYMSYGQGIFFDLFEDKEIEVKTKKIGFIPWTEKKIIQVKREHTASEKADIERYLTHQCAWRLSREINLEFDDTNVNNIVTSYVKKFPEEIAFIEDNQKKVSNKDLENVLNRGYVSLHKDTMVNQFQGVKLDTFERFTSTLVSIVSVADSNADKFKEMLETIKNSPENKWSIFSMVYSDKSTETTKYLSLLGRRNKGGESADILVGQISMKFTLAPDLVIIRERTAAGNSKESITERVIVKKVPAEVKKLDLDVTAILSEMALFKAFSNQIKL